MTDKPTTSKNKNWIWRFAIGLVVMGLIVWGLARELDWQNVIGVLREANYWWVACSVLLQLASLFTRMWRWQVLLRDPELKLRPTMTALVVGQMVNIGLPVMRSGDVARALWIGREESVSASEALGTIALEKVWNLVAAFFCGVILLLTVPLPDWFTQSTWGTALLLVVGIAVLIAGLQWKDALFTFALRFVRFLPERWTALIVPRIERIIRGLDSIREPSTSASVFLWTVVTWLLGILLNWCVMMAFGVQSIPAAILLIVTLMLGIAAVPTPGQFGVYEGICVVSLSLLSIVEDRAFAIGLVLHLVTIVVPAFVAALLVMWSQVRVELEPKHA